MPDSLLMCCIQKCKGCMFMFLLPSKAIINAVSVGGMSQQRWLSLHRKFFPFQKRRFGSMHHPLSLFLSRGWQKKWIKLGSRDGGKEENFLSSFPRILAAKKSKLCYKCNIFQYFHRERIGVSFLSCRFCAGGTARSLGHISSRSLTPFIKARSASPTARQC